MGQSQTHNRQSRTPIPSVPRHSQQPKADAAVDTDDVFDESASPGPIESRLDEAETRRWEAAFGGLCLAGHLRREEFRRLCAAVFPDVRTASDAGFADRVFLGFDETGRGAVRFREFLAGLSVATNCGPEERLRWALGVYGGGGRRLSLGEVADIFCALGDIAGGGVGDLQEPPEQRARQLLHRLGRDAYDNDDHDDCSVTVDEFVAAVVQEPDVRSRLLAWTTACGDSSEQGGSDMII